MAGIDDIAKKTESVTPWGAIAQGAGTLLGIGLDNTRQKQQYQNQVDLMGIQQRNQMELNRQGQQIAKENWDYTNYENQVKHMQNAGLNVGLMYQGGGQGGQSTSASGGSAASGQAPTIGTNNATMVMQLGTQLALTQAEVELKKAQTRNLDEDTSKKSIESEGIALANNFEGLLQKAGQDGKTDANGQPTEPLKLQKYKQEILQLITGINKTGADIKNVNANTENTNADTKNILSDTELKKQLKEFKDKTNPVELEQMQKELEKYKADPTNNKIVMWIEKILGLIGGVSNIIK